MIKLLFVHGSTRWIHDEDNNLYTSTTFNEKIWQRYQKHCDQLTVLLRKDNTIYKKDEAVKKFNYFSCKNRKIIEVPDVYYPFYNIFNVKYIYEISKAIRDAVIEADYVIIRSFGNIYTYLTAKYAKKFNKPFLVEVTGFELESDWFHSLKGKFVAYPREFEAKKMLSETDYAIYVTEQALQKRYPCRGISVGCSDVEINIDLDAYNRRFNKKNNGIITLGTAAALDVGWKGHETVFKALSAMEENERSKYQYLLIGSGDKNVINKKIRKYNLQNTVKVVGTIPHDKVFEWFDNLDIYIQSSYMEGLCRSIVEAMSRACPVICSDVGGNFELIDQQFLFRAGDYMEFLSLLRKCTNKDILLKMAQDNFVKSSKFDQSILDKKRDNFLTLFTGK